jgi:hypothetical protein
MFGFRSLPPDGRSRRKAARVLFIMHGAESTPEGRALLLLRQWLSPAQHEQFLRKGYFEVVGNETGKRYRIYPGTSVNVCELDKRGRPQEGLCFTPFGTLPIGDVMLAQKIALETCESKVNGIARRFVPNALHFRSAGLLR